MAPAAPLAGVSQLPPGRTAHCRGKERVASPPPSPLPDCLEVKRYWYPEFLAAREDAQHPDRATVKRMAAEVREKLVRVLDELAG